MKFNDIKISDCLLKENNFPLVFKNCLLKEALDEMDKFKLGVVVIVNSNKELEGIITDGDIRRSLIKNQKPLSAALVDDAIKYSIKNPKYIDHDNNLYDSIKFMNNNNIWDLPVVKNGCVVGLLHLHSALSKLIF
tara:strand:- start:10 stop:414 length:405 start_codon:yes stop_codon:yes gene_type:complete